MTEIILYVILAWLMGVVGALVVAAVSAAVERISAAFRTRNPTAHERSRRRRQTPGGPRHV